MVDWLSVELPDPFGFLITGGEVTKSTEHGEVEWTTRCKRQMEGSWSGKMMVRNLQADRRVGPGLDPVRSGLELAGNPAKFLYGHNLFGSANVAQLAADTVYAVRNAVAPDIDLGLYDPGAGEISRIDLTGSWLLDRPDDVVPFLRALEERVFCPYRGRGVRPNDDPGTLVYGYSDKGKRAKDWQLVLYSKGREIAVHKLPEPALAVPGLLDEVNRTVRVELRLRSAELKRLGMKFVRDWTPERVEEIWSQYVGRLDFAEAKMSLENDLSTVLTPRLLRAYRSWQAGDDMSRGIARTTFYKLRRDLIEAAGVDIALPVPKSNVVPLRRIIEARPASRPLWADDLTAALRQVA